MNRRPLLLTVLVIFLFVISACGGKNQTAASKTQEIVQAAQPTATESSATSSSAQTGNTSQTEPTTSPTTEPTQAPTQEQPAPTQAPTSTGETGSSSSPTAAPTQPTEGAGTSSCLNKAAFYEDVTIPDDTVIRQGDKFTKTWRVRNEGDCTWKGYQLVYAGGEAMNAAPANTVPEAAPGSIIDISVDMTAPGRGGTYLSYWQFSTTNGQTFGVGSGANGLLWARIQVDYASGEITTAGTSSTTSTGTTTSTTTTTSTSTSGTTTAGCNYSLNADYENQIFELINKARADNGLGALTRNAQLDAAALEHSMDMACNDLISHTGSDGSLWYDRVAKQGFANSSTARENIYTGNPDFGGNANGAFTWWMNSQVHRDNILYSTVTAVGISYVYSKNATYGGLYTLVLARP